MTNKILIVEDDEKIATILAKYAQGSGYNHHIINDGAEVISWVKANEPDAILLDIMLPNVSGTELCKQIREFSEVPVLMATAKVEEIDRLLGLEIGADDYICKPFSPKEVMARIKTILRRVPTKAPDSLFQLDVVSQRAKLQNIELPLTPVEFRILHAFTSKPDNVWNREQLLNKMYDDYREVSDRTVDSHVANLRKKLLASQLKHDFIGSVYGVGYRFVLP
ncbi:response regulator [Shewanella woodyi]|uniref:Two component transcriptional regulator, winged helix family n=1 Tax=Shewanella woodyi (strain ATCC 51908 / MS32) TaxID=392500 RepID=B1KG82_SHEWM|nr:response regulator [Shewanella woodyi]ACA88219.1 two component transcriptional regulator, winged helix family [Shewanella woodyi ATCC 51908]